MMVWSYTLFGHDVVDADRHHHFERRNDSWSIQNILFLERVVQHRLTNPVQNSDTINTAVLDVVGSTDLVLG
jgi:hypothetical protein